MPKVGVVKAIHNKFNQNSLLKYRQANFGISVSVANQISAPG